MTTTKKLTQDAFAKRVGCDFTAVCRYLKGERLPKPERLGRIIEEFDLNPVKTLTAYTHGPGSFAEFLRSEVFGESRSPTYQKMVDEAFQAASQLLPAGHWVRISSLNGSQGKRKETTVSLAQAREQLTNALLNKGLTAENKQGRVLVRYPSGRIRTRFEHVDSPAA